MTDTGARGNFISEWFGHRMFPRVVSTARSLEEQRQQKCPFLSAAKGGFQECIKPEAAKGVCTISSRSNGPRQDWVVCPYRAFDLPLMRNIVSRLYGFASDRAPHLFPAPTLAVEEKQTEVLKLIEAGEIVLIYFDQKMGGEIHVPPTDRSPQIAFDTTFVELSAGEQRQVRLGRFAVVEIQTMDFHGSYRRAVQNLKDALRLHDESFPAMVQANSNWLSEGIEGPNIANVFKRTFYQLMFKFEIALTPGCAGAALAIPTAVWDSWQKFLGAPTLVDEEDSLSRLALPRPQTEPLPSYIYVFEFDESSEETPSPMRVRRIIRTSAEALSHYAIEEAPKGAIEQLRRGVYPLLQRRLRQYWPLDVEIPTPAAPGGALELVEEERPIEEAELED